MSVRRLRQALISGGASRSPQPGRVATPPNLGGAAQPCITVCLGEMEHRASVTVGVLVVLRCDIQSARAVRDGSSRHFSH